VTISVVTEPLNLPPRNRITVAVAAGNVMNSAALYRTTGGVRSLVREQPAAGLDSRLVDDYECPRGVPATYDWTVNYTDPAAYTTVWNETWANLTNWGGPNPDWSVAAGKVRNATAYVGGSPMSISRTVASGKYRVTIASHTTGGSITLVRSLPGGSFQFLVLENVGGLVVVSGVFSGGGATTISAASPYTIDITATTVLLSGTGGTKLLYADFAVDHVQIESTAGTIAAFQVGAIKVESYPAPTVLAETASPVTLNSDDMWLVHPASPGLSVPVSLTDDTHTALSSIEQVENESTTTLHYPLGQTKAIPTNTGPRLAGSSALVLTTVTRADMLAINAMLADQTPILILTPPAWDIDFDDDFYAIGDLRAVRRIQAPSDPARVVTLPLTAVDSPIVVQGDTGWSYAAETAEFTSYTEVSSTFATYADETANVRL